MSNTDREDHVRNSAPTEQQQRSYQAYKSGRARKYPSIEHWPKLNAATTKRVQDRHDKEAEKTSKESEYLTPPLNECFPAEGYYLWHDAGVPPSDILGENLHLLNGVRTNFKAFINYDESVGCIRIRSENLQNVMDGITGIMAKIQQARANATGLAPLFIVEPPSVKAMKSNVSPEFRYTREAETQPIVERVLLSGPTLSAENSVRWESERVFILERNQSLFSEHVKKGLAEFRALKCGMRLRVQFGHIRLLLYRKDFRDSPYSFQRFSKMMRESRTRAKLEKELGDATFAAKVLNYFRNASDSFEPMDSQIAVLADAKPKHSLVVLARGSSNQQVRVEADIDTVDNEDGAQANVGRRKRLTWQIGTTRYYQHNSRKTRLMFGSLGFESTFDWCLEMVTNETIANPPPVFQSLVASSLSNAPIHEDKLFFHYPSIALRAQAGLQVDKTWIRSVLQYKLKSSPYIVEVAIYRVLEKELPSDGYMTNCGISFYNKNWDFLMAPDENVVDSRNTFNEAIFPGSSDFAGGCGDFLKKVQVVQTCLDGVFRTQ